MHIGKHLLLAACAAATLGSAQAQGATFQTLSLTPETALKAAQAALAHCRAQGFQATIAVVDRAGLTQVLLRDRFAGPHTVEVAADKAWTAVSFRLSTTELARESQAGKPMSGLRSLPRFMAVGGGMVDVEFVVQHLVLAHASAHPALCRNSGNIALLQAAEQAALLPPGMGQAAARAYRALRQRQHRARLDEASTQIDPALVAEHSAAVRALWAQVFAG